MSDADANGRSDFERAMADVEPIEADHQPERRRRVRRMAQAAAAAPRFEIEREASRVYGRREDTPEERLQELRRGDVAIGNRLDLHGMTEEVARVEVFRFVRQSSASRLAAVALVHGRGLRSVDGAVLRQQVPRWLVQLPLARLVRAFASAPPGSGGDGVTWVLLDQPT